MTMLAGRREGPSRPRQESPTSRCALRGCRTMRWRQWT